MTDQQAPPEQETLDVGPQVRPFADFLRQQAYGATHDELTDKLHELLAAVRETGRAGGLSLTIKVKPVGKATSGEIRQIVVTDTVVVKKPAYDRAESVFFLDADGNASRTDPRQPELPLQAVSRPADTAPIKAVNR